VRRIAALGIAREILFERRERGARRASDAQRPNGPRVTVLANWDETTPARIKSLLPAFPPRRRLVALAGSGASIDQVALVGLHEQLDLCLIRDSRAEVKAAAEMLRRSLGLHLAGEKQMPLPVQSRLVVASSTCKGRKS
jgi:hypothetical protein